MERINVQHFFSMKGVRIIYPFFYLFCGLITGLTYFIAEGNIWEVTALAAFCCMFYFSRNKTIYLLGCAAGLLLVPLHEYNTLNEGHVEHSAHKGQVISASVPAGEAGKVRFILKTEESSKIQVYSEYAPHPGEICSITGETAPVFVPASPFQFDYAAHLKSTSIDSQFFAEDIYCSGKPSAYYELIENRSSFIKEYNAQGNEIRALFTALVFGERGYIEEDRIELYQRMGVIHLLAVSGLHVGLISGAVWLLLVKFGVVKQNAAAVIFFIMPVYILFAGAAPSVIRSGIMMMIGLGLFIIKRKFPLLEICSFTGVALLIFNPFILLHIGFQLSFITSISLILSTKILRGSRFLAMIKVTVAAQLISLPLILFHFHEISLLSVAANAVFIPLIAFVILPASFGAVISSGFSAVLPNFIEFLAGTALSPAHVFLEWMNQFTFHMLTAGSIKPSTAFILLSMVVMLFYAQEMKKRIAAASVMVISSLLIILLAPYADSNAYVHFLSVGQGDAAVIELPYREAVYMIDTGGEMHFTEEGAEISASGPGKNIILPFLKGRGIREIDKLILSHGHADHIGEVCLLAEKISIKRVLYPYSRTLPELAVEQFSCLEENNIPVTFVHAGDEWTRSDHFFDIVHPDKDHLYEENDLSLVLKAEIDGVEFLFTGDIESGAEADILLRNEDVQAEILKAAHHGSSTSSTEPFIDAVAPAAAVISAGINNRYGHPSPETVGSFQENQIEVFRTDEDGTVTFQVKQGRWKAQKFIE